MTKITDIETPELRQACAKGLAYIATMGRANTDIANLVGRCNMLFHDTSKVFVLGICKDKDLMSKFDKFYTRTAKIRSENIGARLKGFKILAEYAKIMVEFSKWIESHEFTEGEMEAIQKKVEDLAKNEHCM